MVVTNGRTGRGNDDIQASQRPANQPNQPTESTTGTLNNDKLDRHQWPQLLNYSQQYLQFTRRPSPHQRYTERVMLLRIIFGKRRARLRIADIMLIIHSILSRTSQSNSSPQ